MAISRYERTLPILDVGKRSEAVVLQLEVPIGVIEGLSSLLSWHCALVKVAGESLSSIRASRAGNLDGEGKAKIVDEQMDEGRKRVLLIAASILAARKQWDGKPSPASEVAIADAITTAERIMAKIDNRWPTSNPAKAGT
jgi:hypothetical protein